LLLGRGIVPPDVFSAMKIISTISILKFSFALWRSHSNILNSPRSKSLDSSEKNGKIVASVFTNNSSVMVCYTVLVSTAGGPALQSESGRTSATLVLSFWAQGLCCEAGAQPLESCPGPCPQLLTWDCSDLRD
jgi:hypothetical protein